MGVYVLTDGEGSYIHKDEGTGKYVPVKNFKKATQWDSLIKANRILNSCVAKAIRVNYAVQFFDTENTVEKNNTAIHKEISLKTSEDDNIEEWIDKINIIKDAISGSDTRYQELNNKLSEVDKGIVDIEHYIEFGKFNAYQGWLCFKMLQDLLRQRRRVKNERQVLELIRQSKIDGEVISHLSQTIYEIRNKRYTPRVFPELFNSGT